MEEAPTKKPVPEVSQKPSEPGWLSEVNHLFGPEITKLKGLAIGSALGVVRDLITQSGPEQMKAKVTEVMDSITVKLGGEPIRGPVLKDNLRAKEEDSERNASKIGGAPAATRRQAQTTVVTVGGPCESG